MEEYNKLNPTAQVEWSEALIAYKELQQGVQQSGQESNQTEVSGG